MPIVQCGANRRGAVERNDHTEGVVKKVLVLLLLLVSPGRAGADPVIDWNETALSAAFAANLDNLTFGCNDALHESRIMAMMHVAIHDALNAIDRRYQPYAFDGHAPDASPDAAVAAAAHDVLVATYPRLPGEIGLTPDAAISLVEAAYANSLAAIPDGSAKSEGILIGRAAAAAIVALRAHDNAELPFIVHTYVPGPNPGDFQFIPGFGPIVAAPYWGQVTPFVLRSSSQYQPKAPYEVSSKKYAADFNEVKSLGAKDSTSRTQDQTEIAYFWVEGAPQGWNRIARAMAVERGLDPWENARLFGLLNLASADAYIADFENKYFYEFWRPITAVRAGETDGNSDTIGDPNWMSEMEIGPVPEYPSGHSGQGGAMSTVLARFFGDRISFSTTSTMAPGATRAFTSFSEAAVENGNSRIYVGFHFRHAVTEGIKLGTKVGTVTFNHYLRPVQ
jgi:hypothetical protein